MSKGKLCEIKIKNKENFSFTKYFEENNKIKIIKYQQSNGDIKLQEYNDSDNQLKIYNENIYGKELSHYDFEKNIFSKYKDINGNESYSKYKILSEVEIKKIQSIS